jgi:hypothetical protein
MFDLDSKQPKPDDTIWTGAEVKSCCETAALLGLSLVDASQYIIPVSVSGAEEHQRLRKWAHGRCLSADVPGVFQCAAAGPIKPARKVRRGDPSAN